jgi:hypothetical protein
MRTITIYSPTVMAAFNKSIDDATYWTEWLSYTLLKNIENMAGASFTVEQVESTDFDTVEGVISTWESDFDTWLDSAATASASELPIPAPPSLPDLGDMGGNLKNFLLSAITQIGIKLVVRWIKGKFDSGSDFSEVAQILRSGLLFENAEGDPSPLLELLAENDLRIIVDRFWDLQDVSYDG